MYLTDIKISGIRGLQDCAVQLQEADGTPRMRTAVIGKNSTYKTTLLRSIAIGLANEADATTMLAEPVGGFVAQGKTEATIVVQLTNSNDPTRLFTVRTTIKKEGEYERADKAIEGDYTPPFVAGYGVGVMKGGEDEFRSFRILDSTYSLFNYSHQLVPTELAIRRLQDFQGDSNYENTKKALIAALGLPPDTDYDTPKGGGLVFSGPSIGSDIPLDALADGYRVQFIWIVDFFHWAMRAKALSEDGQIRGILLIDELEKHLHPAIQTNVLDRLIQLWPDVQTIGTTHSPLVTLGAQAHEIIVLRRDNGSISYTQDPPDFTGYSAEDVLMDEHLFATSAYSPQINALLEQYRALVECLPNLSKTQQQRMSYIARRLREHVLLPDEDNQIRDQIDLLKKELGLSAR